ncbi:response regulator [Salidesulfovibrio onnuriiensis]|uniref:response regulator n=1 Tax=Salidesulfovibrio onnuriiensis TaxID=2583823 RepID=UPI00165017BA|nr:response regulator [Salidesulfovibrio onnuriiensis]
MPNILVVDDSRTVRNMVSHMLTKTGAAITIARDGAEGLEAAATGSFDLIITDVKMPRMNGYQLCSKVNKEITTPPIPVLIMSADVDEHHVENGFLAGAWGHIPKHNLKNELIPRVREILRRRRIARDWRFLIAEPSQKIRTHLRAELPAMGIRAATAGCGETTIQALKHHHPDFIFLDVAIPDMKIEHLCRTIRDMPGMEHIPIALMSWSSQSEALQSILEGYSAAHLQKPFSTAQLILMAERLLMDNRTRLASENLAMRQEFKTIYTSMAEMVQTLENRDAFTRGHSEKVAELSAAIGRQLGLSLGELERLTLAARLHDIGKVGIRDSLLLKPEELSTEEMEAIRRHPEAGARLLEPLARLDDVIPAVRQHHERFDGKGYPAGLKGNAINLMARIIAVGDAYQAMVSERPYRKAKKPHEALQTMREALGTQFCPTCGRAFLEYMEQSRRAEASPTTSETMPRSAARRRQAPIVGKTIVLAENNSLMRKSIAQELKGRGAAKVVPLSSGTEVWEELNKNLPDIFICEWELPGLNLREIMEKMAWSESLSATATMIMTRGEDRSLLNEIISFQPSCILKKPFALDELCTHMERILIKREKIPDEQKDLGSQGLISDVPTLMKKLHSNMAVEVMDFSTEITDRYRYYFCRFFTSYSLPVPVREVQEAYDDFRQNIINRHMTHCQAKIKELENKLDSGAPGIKGIIATSVTCAMNMLGEMMDEAVYHFRDRLLDCLEDQASKYSDPKEVAWVVDEYKVDITLRVNNRTEAIMTILNENLEAYQDIIGNGYKHYVHSLMDAFGRGLFEPVDATYPITTDIRGTATKQRCFPRELCRPVLSTLRDFIVGKKKYDVANEKILNSVRKYFGHKFGFDRGQLEEYYTHPKVRQYLVSHILNCLKIMSSDLKLENFMRMVNERARQAKISPEIRFEEAQWRMLSSAWRKFVGRNLGDHQKESKAVKEILEGSIQAESTQ